MSGGGKTSPTFNVIDEGDDFRRLLKKTPPSDLQRLLRKTPESDFQRLLKKEFRPRPARISASESSFRAALQKQSARYQLRKLSRKLLAQGGRHGLNANPYLKALDLLEGLLPGWGTATTQKAAATPHGFPGWWYLPGEIWIYSPTDPGENPFPQTIESPETNVFLWTGPSVNWRHLYQEWRVRPFAAPETWVVWERTSRVPPNSNIPDPEWKRNFAPRVLPYPQQATSALPTGIPYRKLNDGKKWVRRIGVSGKLAFKTNPQWSGVKGDDGIGKSNDPEEKPNLETWMLWLLQALADALGSVDELIRFLAEVCGWSYNKEIGGSQRYNQAMWLFGPMKGIQWFDWSEAWDQLIDDTVKDAIFGFAGAAAGLGYKNLRTTTGAQWRNIRW